MDLILSDQQSVFLEEVWSADYGPGPATLADIDLITDIPDYVSPEVVDTFAHQVEQGERCTRCYRLDVLSANGLCADNCEIELRED